MNQTEKPLRHQFMLVSHALLAIAIGYVFGKFAAIVYRRRTTQPSIAGESEPRP